MVELKDLQEVVNAIAEGMSDIHGCAERDPRGDSRPPTVLFQPSPSIAAG